MKRKVHAMGAKKTSGYAMCSKRKRLIRQDFIFRGHHTLVLDCVLEYGGRIYAHHIRCSSSDRQETPELLADLAHLGLKVREFSKQRVSFRLFRLWSFPALFQHEMSCHFVGCSTLHHCYVVTVILFNLRQLNNPLHTLHNGHYEIQYTYVCNFFLLN